MSLARLVLLVVVCFLLSGGVHLLSRRFGWTRPRRLGRNKSLDPPTSEGGVAFLLAFLVCLAASVPYLESDLLLSPEEMRAHHLGLGAALVCLFAVGRWGDGKSHSHWIHLCALLVAGLILALSGFAIETLRVGSTVHALGVLSVPATILWLIVISEFFRLFDGLDGLLVSLVLGVIALQLGFVLEAEEGYARALCLAAVPALLGLLPWRIYPARIELRGIGAFLPGFVVGAISMAGREKAFTTKAVVAPTIAAIAVFSLFCLWLLEQHLFLPKRKG
ncbi:MAG: hypothetical protein HUU16_12815 [Candidatus Omnitrophica bacterium]|nr:hypothetical protein [Candidatus Omnitrophota bacterium]